MFSSKTIRPVKIFIYLLFITAMLPGHLFSQTVLEKNKDGKTMLWMEAEDGSINLPMKVFDNNEASGGQYVEVLGGNNNLDKAPEDGHITYKFTIKKAGTYRVLGRVIASMDDEDAFWARMDNEKWIKWNDISVGCNWHWDAVHDNDNNNKVVEYNLKKGTHTLAFTYCLDQTRLDKILITNDLNYTPDEIGPGAEASFKMTSNKPVVDQSVGFDGSGSASTEGNIVSYKWDFGDGNKAEGKLVNHSFIKEGDFHVRLIVTDDKGLTARLTKELTVYTDNPVANFNYSPDRSKKGENISFDATNSFDPSGSIKNYSWDFGDGSDGNGVNAKHSYTSAGVYYVTLTVTDVKGKSVKETRPVTVITGIPKKVIFETDMCLDADDVGALAILNAMADQCEAEILAVCYNEVQPFGASAIDAINTWYGRGDIPIGIYKKPLINPDYSPYLEPVSKFPHDLDSKSASSALEVYQNVLSQQPDSSVTIISVGFLNNLNDLLNADSNLVVRKVKELVIMGGVHNDGFNLSRHNLVSASENVIRNWPSPLVISQAGGNILTSKMLKNSPVGNPVREAFYKFFHNNFCERPSWDEMAVLYGVRGLSNYYTMVTTGTGSLPNGYKWQMKASYRSYLETRLSREAYENIIQNLMMKPPVK